MESPPGQELELAALRAEHLHAAHVGGHQGNGGVEDPLIQGMNVILADEQGADFLKLQRLVRSRIGFCLWSRRRSPCCCEISEPVGECITAREIQPAFLYAEKIGLQG